MLRSKARVRSVRPDIGDFDWFLGYRRERHGCADDLSAPFSVRTVYFYCHNSITSVSLSSSKGTRLAGKSLISRQLMNVGVYLRTFGEALT